MKRDKALRRRGIFSGNMRFYNNKYTYSAHTYAYVRCLPQLMDTDICVCMCVCEHDIWCMTCLSTMPGRAETGTEAGAVLSLLKLNIYVCMEYIDWEDLLFFCLLLAQKDTGCSTCWDRAAQGREGQSRAGQSRTGQERDRAGQGRKIQDSRELSSSCCKLTAHLDGRPTWRALMSCQIWVHRLWILMASHGSMNRPGDCHLWRISG